MVCTNYEASPKPSIFSQQAELRKPCDCTPSMADSSCCKSQSFSLPPGCRFFPSEEHLFGYYLTNKNLNRTTNPLDDGTSRGYNLITELNLYDYDPFDLPEVACFPYGREGSRRHWYCYTIRFSDSGGARRTRMTKGGYWKRRGRVRNVSPGGINVLGTRTSFAFYLGRSAESAVRTDWVMYEYALNDHPEASFVLCRLFVRSLFRNSTSENGLSYCAGESVTAVGHMANLHDRVFITDAVDAKGDDENSVYRKNEISAHSLGITSAAAKRGPSFTKTVPAEHLVSILEGDFIELDDLVD